MRERPPEASPTASSSGGRPTSTPSTSATASWTSGCATDPRVTVLERVNVRTLTPELLRERDPAFEPCSLITADLSFISLVTVVPALCGPLGGAGADLVLLVKPQFEAGRAVVARGKGVVRDPAVWRSSLEGVSRPPSVAPEPASWGRWFPR